METQVIQRRVPGMTSSPHNLHRSRLVRPLLLVCGMLAGSLLLGHASSQAGAPPEPRPMSDSAYVADSTRWADSLATRDSLRAVREAQLRDSLATMDSLATAAATPTTPDRTPAEPSAVDTTRAPRIPYAWGFRANGEGFAEAFPVSNGEIHPVPFGPGERLRYYMEFSFVKAGLSEMAVTGVDTVLGHPAYAVHSRVRSTSGIDLIYKVRDTVRSWFDVGGLYSHRYERDIREGSYRSKKYFDYDHRTGWVSISNENGPKGTTPFLPFSHNIVSALYWVRAQELVENTEMVIPLHDLDTQYPLTVKVYGKETIKVPAGTFECIKVEPVIESEGLFKKAGRLFVWLTLDEHRLPVRMSTEIPVGTVDGNLVEYRLGTPLKPGEAPRRFKEDSDWDW